MGVAVSDMSLKSSAAGQYLGYSLQPVRLCHHLFKVPDGDYVSLEHLDDVAVHRADGTILLEQCKSALSGNPAQDRSKDLWKAFANWATLCAQGTVDIEATSFRYFVTPVKSGPIVHQLDTAATQEECEAVLAAVKKLINPTDPGAGAGPFIKTFLNVGDELCSKIIQRFMYQSELDPLESVREYVRIGVPVEAVDDTVAAVIGLAKDRADRLIRENKAPIVGATELRRAFQSLSLRSNLTNLAPASDPSVPAEEISAIQASTRLFVRQLRAIDASEKMLVTAISDFLRTTTDRIHWADKGFVVDESLDEFEANLIRLHTNTREEIEDIYSSEEEPQRGRRLYRRCAETVMPLSGRAVPSYFPAGTFNELADQLRVGWHPQYETKFSKDA